MELIDTFPYHLESTHADFTGGMAWSFLGNQLLYVAGKHAERRGWGMRALNDDHRTWVLSRLSIEMNEMPVWSEDIEISTWVEGVMRMFNFRNFAIKKADGTPCGYARSVWSVIDTITRKPYNFADLDGGSFQKLIVPAEENICPIDAFKPCRFNEPLLEHTIMPTFSDIDVNGHVNSIRYIEHILDLFPLEQYKSQRLHRLDIAYKVEALATDVLDCYLERSAHDVYEVEIRKSANETVCQARIEFTD